MAKGRSMPFTRLRYHIVFATKDRADLIDSELEEFLYPVLGAAVGRNDGQIINIGGVEDHVHLICGVRPVITMSDFVRRVKSESSGAVRRNFKRRRGFKWQVGYGAFTLSALGYQDAVAYVKNQKEHHRLDTLREPFERMDENEEEDDADVKCAG
jgi:REP element-mobilizing transposase RayT